MYFVKYGDEYLHNPNDNESVLLDLALDYEENSCGFCDFTIYPNHPLYDKLKACDYIRPVTVYDNDYLLFSGFIYELGKEFQLDGHVKCKGELAYLNMSIIRPYNLTFNSIGEYIGWLIEKHNSQVDSTRHFSVGNVPTDKKVLKIKNDGYTTTLDAINSNLIDNSDIGGYISVRNDGDIKYIDFKLKRDSYNYLQSIDFGVNLL